MPAEVRPIGLGSEVAEEFSLAAGQVVEIVNDRHMMQGTITDIGHSSDGKKVYYVWMWGGQSKPFLAEDLKPVETLEASVISRFLRSKLSNGEHHG